MANTVENTFRKIGNTLEYIFNGGTTEQPITNTNGMGTPSNLEMYGRQARGYHLMRNEWKKDIQYTRSLVNAEYMIQTEFKIDGGSGEDLPTEKVDDSKKKAAKAKKAKKDKQKEEKTKPIDERKEPKVTIQTMTDEDIAFLTQMQQNMSK